MLDYNTSCHFLLPNESLFTNLFEQKNLLVYKCVEDHMLDWHILAETGSHDKDFN